MVVLYLYCLSTIFVAFIPSTDVIQLTLTLKMTTAQVVETSVTVKNNSPIQDYVHPDDQTQPTFEIFVLMNIQVSLRRAASYSYIRQLFSRI